MSIFCICHFTCCGVVVVAVNSALLQKCRTHKHRGPNNGVKTTKKPQHPQHRNKCQIALKISISEVNIYMIKVLNFEQVTNPQIIEQLEFLLELANSGKIIDLATSYSLGDGRIEVFVSDNNSRFAALSSNILSAKSIGLL